MKTFKEILRERIESFEGVTIQDFDDNGTLTISVYSQENRDILRAFSKKVVLDVIEKICPLNCSLREFKYNLVGGVQNSKDETIAHLYKIKTPFTSEVVEGLDKDRAEDLEFERMREK